MLCNWLRGHHVHIVNFIQPLFVQGCLGDTHLVVHKLLCFFRQNVVLFLEGFLFPNEFKNFGVHLKFIRSLVDFNLDVLLHAKLVLLRLFVLSQHYGDFVNNLVNCHCQVFLPEVDHVVLAHIHEDSSDNQPKHGEQKAGEQEDFNHKPLKRNSWKFVDVLVRLETVRHQAKFVIAIDHPEVEDIDPCDANLAQVEGLKQVPVHSKDLQEDEDSCYFILKGVIWFHVELDEPHQQMGYLQLQHHLLKLLARRRANVEVQIIFKIWLVQ